MPILKETPSDHGTNIELVEGDVSLSWLLVWDLQMRIGNIPLRCGGIAGVTTPRAHRMKGYSRQVLEGTIDFMKREGYHLSALFGIPDYYPKYGYASALVDCECVVTTRNAEGARNSHTIRPFAPEDAKQVALIYRQMSEDRSGSIVRDPDRWTQFALGSGWTDRLSAFVALDASNEIAGYACYNIDHFRFGIGEVGYRDHTVFDSLLSECARLAVEMRAERIKFHAPADDAFLRHCRRYGCELTLKYPSRASGMARICDQSGLLQNLQPLFEARLASSALADWQGSLRWETDLGCDVTRLGAGAQHTVRVGQAELAQLLLGFRTVDDLLLYNEVSCDDEAAAVIRALCPPGYPYIYQADRF